MMFKQILQPYRNKRKRKKLKRLYNPSNIYKMLDKDRRHLWLVAAPKSGSTWLSSIIDECLGWKKIPLVALYDRREQEVEPSQLLALEAQTGNIFSPHQHCRYSESTKLFIENANVSVILLVRNIFDTVISLFDHYQNESFIGPMSYMDDINWIDLSSEQRMDFIIDMVLPWYFNFYAGWLSSNEYCSGKIKLITYEELLQNPDETISEVFDFFNIKTDTNTIKSSITNSASKNTRKNKAVTGRGDKLTSTQKSKIMRYAQYYPHIDFSVVGL